MNYQNKNLEYIDAEAYDKRGEASLLEKYVLDLWQPFLKKIIRNLSIGKTVVDLGCGTCEYTQAAQAARKIYAVDISESMLKVCRQKLGRFPQAEIINLPIKDFNLTGESADLVITIGVWEYIDSQELLEAIKKITHRCSKIIIVFPNRYNGFHIERSIAKGKWSGLRPGFIRRIFKEEFLLLDSASFANVCWAPKSIQFLVRPFWQFGDWLWSPFQKFLPLGVNIYYLFERK